MRCFWLAIVVAGVVAACGGSTDDLFNRSGPASGSGGAAGAGGVLGAGGSNGVAGAGGSNGVAGAGGSNGVAGAGGSSGVTSSGGSSGSAGSSGNAGQSTGGSSATGGFNGSGGGQGSSGSSGSGGVATGGTGGVIDPGDASTDASEDAGRACPAGNYAGSLRGPYRSRLGNSTFTARIELTINGEGAAHGRIIATSAGSGRATLQGKLDCKTGDLKLDITEGSYSDALGTNRYTGKMSATHAPATQSFPDGTFTVTETNPMYGGEGTWNASLSSG